MEKNKTSPELFRLLNEALARELQVSVQYMLQHTIWNGKSSTLSSIVKKSPPGKFVASHSPVFFPSKSLKKTAITEMTHAEDIAERITILGGDIIKEIPPYSVGDSLREILVIDKTQEVSAIQLYNKILLMAKEEGDKTTVKMIENILSDEEDHHKIFSSLLEML